MPSRQKIDSRAFERLKKKIKRVLLVYRTDSHEAHSKAEDAVEWLTTRKVEVLSHPKQSLGRGIKRMKQPT
jgi:hypothetical protein